MKPLRRRSLALLLAAALLGLAAPALPAPAQPRKDTVVLGMTLEPPGLDPTAGAASAIAEVVLYNVFETLTQVRGDGSVGPLLAESWTVSPDAKTYTFKLRRGVTFHNGEPFDAAAVRYSFERAAAQDSVNKDKAVFANIAAIGTPDRHTVVLTLKNGNPDLLFQLGQGTAIIVEPRSAAGNNTRPVGTGPFKLDNWSRGSSITLLRWDGWRNPKAIAMRRATFRFINDPAAQVAALLSGDVDAFPRVAAARSLEQFKRD
ncbi:MAG TPA: ABC transporter substrate-binding protein, partial [Rubrivivax sp.]|nr:ABC transporter substrate-binding protein [Rubrivivax sp.]